MAILAGNAGSFKLGANTVLEIDQWQLDVTPGLEETQSFGDTWKERTLTLKEWSGSASGRLDNTDTNGHVALATAFLAGSTVAGRWYYSATAYYSGTAFVTASITAAENGLMTVSYSFNGTGALSHTP